MSRQRSLTIAIVAGVVAIGLGIWLSFEIPWFPVQASAQAHNTDRLYHVLVIATIPIFVGVVGVILYCVWQFRMKPGEELKDGPPIHGNTRPEAHRLSARCSGWPNAMPRHGAEAAWRCADTVPAPRWPSKLLELPFQGDGAVRRPVG